MWLSRQQPGKMGLSGNEDLRLFIEKLAVSSVSQYIEFPMITVMGDTSSGKSSLLTSTSMVELPSSEKLTTRCPIRLRMKPSEKKTAHVTVVWKDRPAGKAEQDLAFSRKVDTSNWKDLTGFISAAQSHIMTLSGKSAANAVARDIVQVDVTGPECEDLTLIDLPGIVRSTGAGESANLVDDIQNLINEYLHNHRCVILAVQPANVDFHNSQIMADAKKVDPETKRTLPVITKPDLSDEGAENGVKKLLLGEKTDKFEKGFHMVKGRGQKALNNKQSVEGSLQDEESFFENTSPWCDVSERSLFGTKELRKKLGAMYKTMITDSFPSIARELKQELVAAQEERKNLGTVHESEHDRRLYFNAAVKRIAKAMESKRMVSGRLASAEFQELCEAFKVTVSKGQLANVSTLVEGKAVIVLQGNFELKGKVVKVDGDNVYLDIDDTEKRSGLRGTFEVRSQYKTNEPAGTDWIDVAKQICIARKDGCYDVLQPFPKSKVRRDNEELRKLIADSRTIDLPVFLTPAVFNSIVLQFIDNDWVEPSFDLLERVSSLLSKALKEVIESERSVTRYPGLRKILLRRCEDIKGNRTAEARRNIDGYLARERCPYTQNDELSGIISQLRTKWLEESIIQALGLQNIPTSSNTTMTRINIKATLDVIFTRNKGKPINHHLAEDMEHVLNAYGSIAKDRFIDEVPKICKEFFVGYQNCLEESLSTITDKELNLVLRDSDDFRINHERVRRKVEDLKEGVRSLNEMMMF